MKKILLVLSMLLLVCSCGTPQAQKDFESMFKALQSGDVKKINQINPDAKISENDFLDGYKKISYKINKTEVEGDKATINLDIKAPDLSYYFPEFFQQAMALDFVEYFGKSEEEEIKIFEDFAIKYFKDKLSSKDLKFTEKNINVIMKKDGKKWKVDKDQSKDLSEILTFGFSKFIG